MQKKGKAVVPAVLLAVVILTIVLLSRGGCGKPPDMNAEFWFTLAPYTNKMAWVAKEEQSFRLMLDGQPVGDTFEGMVTLPIFSPNGQQVAYVIQQGQGQMAMVDGKQIGEAYERIDDLIWSPDSKVIAFFGWKGSDKFAVKDGAVVGGPFMAISGHRFGVNADVYAFAGTADEEVIITLGDREIRRDDVHAWDITGDGTDIYHTLRTENGWQLIRNDTDVICDSIDALSIGRAIPSIAYTEVKEGKVSVVRDGNPVGGPYYWATKPVFSSNGLSMAYAASDGKPAVFVDGKKIPPKDNVENIDGIIFGPDNKAIAYAAKAGQFWYVYKNDLRVSDGFEQVLPLLPNADGKKIVFAGLKNGKTKKIEIPW